MSDDALLDSLLEAATKSLQKKAGKKTDEQVAPIPVPSLKRKRTEEPTLKPETNNAVPVSSISTKIEPPSAATRADALRKEQEAKAAKLDPKKPKKEISQPTSGPKWFDLPGQEMTPEVRQHLQVLNMRHVIDPKRHYKRTGKKGNEMPKFFQIGTLVEGAGEYYTARVAKRDKNKTLVDELLEDANTRQKYKEKYLALQASRVRHGKAPIRGKGKMKKRR